MNSKQPIGFREKLRARLCKEVPVSKEQKLSRKIEDLTAEAQTLHNAGNELHEKAEKFGTRAANTLPPSSAPPAGQDPLFRAKGETAPASEYEAQRKAYELLLRDWKGFQREVKAHEKRIGRFASCLEAARKKHGSRKAFGETDHHFERLTNALHNLREQKKQIDRAVGEIPLPAGNKMK